MSVAALALLIWGLVLDKEAPSVDRASVQRSLDDAQRSVDLIFAAAARRMRELSQRDGRPDWMEW